MLNKKIKGSIRTATDFWGFILFVVFSSVGVFYMYHLVHSKAPVVCKDNCDKVKKNNSSKVTK